MRLRRRKWLTGPCRPVFLGGFRRPQRRKTPKRESPPPRRARGMPRGRAASTRSSRRGSLQTPSSRSVKNKMPTCARCAVRRPSGATTTKASSKTELRPGYCHVRVTDELLSELLVIGNVAIAVGVLVPVDRARLGYEPAACWFRDGEYELHQHHLEASI